MTNFADRRVQTPLVLCELTRKRQPIPSSNSRLEVSSHLNVVMDRPPTVQAEAEKGGIGKILLVV